VSRSLSAAQRHLLLLLLLLRLPLHADPFLYTRHQSAFRVQFTYPVFC
jgi:hypothetical protein